MTVSWGEPTGGDVNVTVLPPGTNNSNFSSQNEVTDPASTRRGTAPSRSRRHGRAGTTSCSARLQRRRLPLLGARPLREAQVSGAILTRAVASTPLLLLVAGRGRAHFYPRSVRRCGACLRLDHRCPERREHCLFAIRSDGPDGRIVTQSRLMRAQPNSDPQGSRFAGCLVAGWATACLQRKLGQRSWARRDTPRLAVMNADGSRRHVIFTGEITGPSTLCGRRMVRGLHLFVSPANGLPFGIP